MHLSFLILFFNAEKVNKTNRQTSDRVGCNFSD